MSLEQVFTKNAPAPRPVYSQAIVANNFVFCSGQLPKDPATNKLLDADVETCTVSVRMVSTISTFEPMPRSITWRTANNLPSTNALQT